ncbi:hypothetical protein Sde_2796 [Saccharophagus degradans 2-40]|uniref:DNA2/NAM7 helicase-like C-terminal domain-containing protein n=1 Tax=Saccharophagus degradans (strain 2-40 / ATCC 43961 / DSM 17024) TaxID=203122 RepID=Q21GX6_SACD2|nr:AAA domain-containing protein [Saccharophagus degradans]ABD82053.1 hypothetical protein Sde_2796 [Saccharophagus degradans 2-40]
MSRSIAIRCFAFIANLPASHQRQTLLGKRRAAHVAAKPRKFVPLKSFRNYASMLEKTDVAGHAAVGHCLISSPKQDLQGKDLTTTLSLSGDAAGDVQACHYVSTVCRSDNHQVSKLRAALGEQAKVDKFQDQEAPIVFLSMCASDTSESPRGLNFLFDKHRINVAISRAQSLAVVVGNPNIDKTPVSRVDQLK